MNWKVKAATHGLFSIMPGGDLLNHLCQVYVTHSLPERRPAGTEDREVRCAQHHLDLLSGHSKPLSERVFFEFGAGHTLETALAFYGLGVNRQIVVDIAAWARPWLVNHTIETLAAVSDLPRKPHHPIESTRDLTRLYGIDYRAPMDASRTGLASGTVDCITSTSVLEHVPPKSIRAILRECHRILTPEGLVSMRINYKDHYFHAAAPYHFLRYSDLAWWPLSPPLHYQNRLRHRDYLEMFDAAGFEVVACEPWGASEENVRAVAELPLSKRFRSYSPEELAIQEAFICVRKRSSRGVH